MLRPLLHYSIHFLVPIGIAFFFYPKMRLKAILLLLMGMLIDADHLLANPVFDANRCSIGFHLLHSYGAILCYLMLFAFPKIRLIAFGLIIHIAADATDCWLMRIGL
ncbi:MAG: hypothetical protein RLZZ241_1220 [Bacteroidota bacterium]|jgi:hypothetical protein